jgi:hypothetical protein
VRQTAAAEREAKREGRKMKRRSALEKIVPVRIA